MRALLRKCGCGGVCACRASQPRVPPIVERVVSSPGEALDGAVRAHAEERLGHDFGRVRVHRDDLAGRSAHSVGALAYSMGEHVVFAPGQYRPREPGGRFLLMHELTHVAQQSGRAQAGPIAVGDPHDSAERDADHHARGARTAVMRDSGARVLRRFTAAERSQIANIDSVVTTARAIAAERGILGLMRWGRFAAGAGGSGAWEAVSGSISRTPLPNRYLFTCRCGLLDMRHFYQLMYAGLLEGNRAATQRGREHEEHAEAASRFAPEDMPSNALGAFFGSQRSLVERQSTFVAGLEAYLRRCRPVDFAALPIAEQDAIVSYYATRPDAARPPNQNQTALPARLPVSVCDTAERGGRPPDRSFPFELDPADLSTIRDLRERIILPEFR